MTVMSIELVDLGWIAVVDEVGALVLKMEGIKPIFLGRLVHNDGLMQGEITGEIYWQS